MKKEIGTVKINYTKEEGVSGLFRGTVGSAGMDVAANSSGIVPCGTTKLVGTGLKFEVPEGKFMRIVPRSGLGLKTHCTIPNSPGTLDSDYRGELGLILHQGYPLDFFKTVLSGTAILIVLLAYLLVLISLIDLPLVLKSVLDAGILVGFIYLITFFIDYSSNFYGFVYKQGDRLAQIIIEDFYVPEFVEVNELSSTVRGDNGYGSTGIKTS